MAIWQGPWGARTTLRSEEEIPQSSSCDQCGAVLAFEPGTESLSCAYCGHVNRIQALSTKIEERDLGQARTSFATEQPATVELSQNCGNCAAEFTLAPDLHAGLCPYCATPLVRDPCEQRTIDPDGILPFLIGDAEAGRLMQNWLKKLWFAPNKLKTHAGSPGTTSGSYLPYFTFDSQTDTDYRGQRGDIYYETIYVRQRINGKNVTQSRRVPKIRWTPVSGHVSRFFDDVLIPATGRDDRSLLDKIDHWDLGAIKPYLDSYLSGFESALYDRSLASSRDDAETVIRAHISFEIKRKIGGDQQRILVMNVRHRDESFKLILLPVWRTVFSFMNKTYPVLINGRTGEVAGKRPYSAWKIAGAVVLGLIIAGGIAVAATLFK